jgi:hypothetical protein
MFHETALVEYTEDAGREVQTDPLPQYGESGRDLTEPLDQWEWVHRRLYHPVAAQKVSITQIYQAYERATGTLLGCD